MDIKDLMDMMTNTGRDVNVVFTTDYDCSCGTKCNLVVESAKDDSTADIIVAVTSCHGVSDIILNNEQTLALIDALVKHVTKGTDGKNKLQ